MVTERLDAPRPPGPDGLPFVGNTFRFARDPLGFLTWCAREYGDVVRIDLAGGPFYQLNHPDHVRHVLVDHNDNYVKGEVFQQDLEILGNGLLNSEGEQWRRQRHRIEPAFHPDRIASYAEPMAAYTDRVTEPWSDGEVVDVHESMMGLTLAIVANALFGVDIRAEEQRIGEALEAVMDHFTRQTRRPVDVPDWLPTPGNRRYHRAGDALESVVYDIIDERREAGSGDDVVSMLLSATDEAGERMSDEQLRDEVMTLVLAGHETTALALTYTLYLLAGHPEVEARVLDELDAVLDGRAPTVEDVADLSYTERVLTESMRLYPPVYGLLREPVADDVVGGYRIPAGETVAIEQWVVHRDPRWYDEPDAFRPERWTDAFRRSLHPQAYFPFSAGPRRCIGDRFARLEATVVLASILRRYRLERVPGFELSLAPAITLRPAGSVEMTVRER